MTPPYPPPSRCRCGAIATKAGACGQHQRRPWAKASRNNTTLTQSQRNAFRRAVLATADGCNLCGSAEQLEADHVVPIAEGGAITDMSNAQALCRSCHAAKSEAERLRGIRRAKGRGV